MSLLLILLVGCADKGEAVALTEDDTATSTDPCAGDADCDGYLDEDDCDDADPSINPGAQEVDCDGIDNDCDDEIDDGSADLYYADEDGDGYGDPSQAYRWCDKPEGAVVEMTLYTLGEDCDDTDPLVHPGATETCNDKDDDCDGEIDEDLLSTFYKDDDGDGFGDPDSAIEACEATTGLVTDGTDCDDTDPTVHPGAEETANGADDDCDGDTDEGLTYIDCQALQAAGASTGSGPYTIDPDPTDAEAPFEVLCEMDIDGGGWTQATPTFLAHLSTALTHQYLYSSGTAWYRSPDTTLVWDWATYQPQDGTYSYATSGSAAMDSFECTSVETGGWGVGCSNGPGSTYKVLPAYASNEEFATSTICQDQPDVFGAGACEVDVAIWVRDP